MGITKWPCFPAKAPWMMIHRDQFSVFLFGLSELIKGRSGLRDQFRSTLAGSGKFYTCKMKPEQKKMPWPLSCSFIWVCFAVLGLHAEEIWKVVRCSSLRFCTQTWQNHLRREIKPRILTTLSTVPPVRFLKANLLTTTQLSRLTLSPTAALLLGTSPSCCYSDSSSCCHLFCHVTWLCALLSCSHLAEVSLVRMQNVPHRSCY